MFIILLNVKIYLFFRCVWLNRYFVDKFRNTGFYKCSYNFHCYCWIFFLFASIFDEKYSPQMSTITSHSFYSFAYFYRASISLFINACMYALYTAHCMCNLYMRMCISDEVIKIKRVKKKY